MRISPPIFFLTMAAFSFCGCQYFLVGMNKAGTSTFSLLCELTNRSTIHNPHWWYWKTKSLSRRRAECFSDGYEGYQPPNLQYPKFERLATKFPKATFFLNTRGLYSWLQSRLCHGKESYLTGYPQKEIDEQIICDWIERRNTLYDLIDNFFRTKKLRKRLVTFSFTDWNTGLLVQALSPYFGNISSFPKANPRKFPCQTEKVDVVMDTCVDSSDFHSLGKVKLHCVCSDFRKRDQN
mmetsp:Transcript_40368/g.56098  ORF Transcript_40368/g.56098 Transcript_40368/m.56098 type:complete len:237 (+) Transcript_40368:83-793(+)